VSEVAALDTDPKLAEYADRRCALVKELNEINKKGTPDGIVLLNADSMDQWVFLISVLGDETIYKVSPG
jgi:hypothetical protein